MLSILVVDDHKEEREGIAFLIKELGFPLQLHVAENGRKALEYVSAHSVDILFTDVRMPIMDGLQLTKEALKLHPKLKVILFSGFAEFEYAKTALSLGVSEYLLKPVNIEAFQTTLEKVIQELKNQQQKEEASQRKLSYVRKHLLFSLVNGIGSPPPLQELSIELPSHYNKMLLLEFDKPFFESVDSEFEEFVLGLVDTSADYLNLNGCQSLLLFPEQESPSSRFDNHSAMHLHHCILDKYKVNCYLAMKEELTSILDLGSLLTSLEELMEYRFFLPDTFVFNTQNDLHFSEALYPDLTDSHLLDQIRNNLKDQDIFSLRANTEILYQKYVHQVQYSHLYVKYMFSTIYQEIMTQAAPISEMELQTAVEIIYGSEDLRDIKDIIFEGIARIDQNSTNHEPTQNRDVDAVKQYIEQYYADDLSLEMLAAKVYLSPHYLSSIFKKQTGCGLNKYIKNVRMQNAKELLTNTHQKISNICTAVGYRNISYFCQNFRDFYGYTPEKYRQYNQKSSVYREEHHATLADT
ncbi:response regulator [Paenibacillus sp. FSL H7-0714]|uniref:response regulator n=1 Tax=Paenibacillus sp. FSL H7-0714 TaxID=2954735 RepID=UPI0030FA5464